MNSGASPDNTVYGNCGQSSLYLNNLGNGNAAFLEGAQSSLGYMTYVSWTVTWDNYNDNYKGSVSGSQVIFGDNWSHTDTRKVYSGDVYIKMTNLYVVLIWGGTCTGGGASDLEYVS